MPADDEVLRLTAYRLTATGMRLVPSEPRRPWMDATPSGYANRCLPLLIANQSGWLLLNDVALVAHWDGGPGREALRIQYDGPAPHNPAISHFGSGILTWTLPYLFRTPPGWNLVIRGAPNNPRPAACPLDAVVETDWATSPFTMNWQLLRAGEDVRVEAGEPLCLLFPQRRGELESFIAEVVDIADAVDVQAPMTQWSQERARFLADLESEGSPARGREWQKDYFQGRSTSGPRPEHQTRLRLSPFQKDGGQ